MKGLRAIVLAAVLALAVARARSSTLAPPTAAALPRRLLPSTGVPARTPSLIQLCICRT